MIEGRPIYFLSKNPKGWLRNSLPLLKSYNSEVFKGKTNEQLEGLSWKEKDAVLKKYAENLQVRNWAEKTGVKPEDTRFTLIIPIHNEEHFLPSVLGTLMMANIPSRANVEVLFITNGCTDNGTSELIVKNFMKNHGDVIVSELDIDLLSEISDRNIDKSYSYVRSGNIKFSHINTLTTGKANALNVANKIALRHSPIAINLDSNNFIEPDAIATLYAEAYDHIVRKSDDKVLVRSTVNHDYRSSRLNGRTKQLNDLFKPVRDLTRSQDIVLVGQFMAWDTNWVDRVGGFPEVLHEDYAIGLLARTSGKAIASAPGAHQWSYQQDNLKDLSNFFARLAQGNFQIMDYFPDLRTQVQKDYHYSKDLLARVSNIIKHLRKKPTKSLIILVGALFLEFTRLKGKRAYQKNKFERTWTSITSTKM